MRVLSQSAIMLLTLNLVRSLPSIAHREWRPNLELGDCNWDMSVEYLTRSSDLSSIRAIEPGICCKHCDYLSDCTHWNWNNGTCHLKGGKRFLTDMHYCAEAKVEELDAPYGNCASGVATRIAMPPSPKLFCFVVVTMKPLELQILSQQIPLLRRCDRFVVFSNSSAQMPATFPRDSFELLQIGSMDVHYSSWNNALNTNIFLPVFRRVYEHYAPNFDWTLKLDADIAVDFRRLRTILLDYDPNIPVLLCTKKMINFRPDPDHPTCLDGPIEIVSRAGAEKYVQYREQCETSIDYTMKGEDWFLDLCFREIIGARYVSEPRVLANSYQVAMPKNKAAWMTLMIRWCTKIHGRGTKAAMHPIKSPVDFEKCTKYMRHFENRTTSATSRVK